MRIKQENIKTVGSISGKSESPCYQIGILDMRGLLKRRWAKEEYNRKQTLCGRARRARSFRFVTAFAGNIVFNYLTVSVYQAKGYSPFTDPPMSALSVKTAGDYHSSN
jgi:hypothetical protein